MNTMRIYHSPLFYYTITMWLLACIYLIDLVSQTQATLHFSNSLCLIVAMICLIFLLPVDRGIRVLNISSAAKVTLQILAVLLCLFFQVTQVNPGFNF